MDLKNLLNDKQYESAVCTSQYTRIIAGAGSGKTRVLTYPKFGSLITLFSKTKKFF